MTNERDSSVGVQVKAGVKTKYRILVLLSIFLGAVAISIYGFFKIQMPSSFGMPEAYETFKSDLQPMKTPLHIVGIGDSLTKGVGDQDQKGYAGMTVEALKKLASTSDVTFKDFGVKGDTTADLLNVLKKEDVKKSIKDADIIFMTIGGNDLVGVLKKNFLSLNISDFKHQRLIYQRNLNAILKTIYDLNPKVTVYYLGLYNPFEGIYPGLDDQFQSILGKWNQGSRTVLELYQHSVFVPTADLFKDKSAELLYKDHFHPNKKGYQLISTRLLAAIENK